MRAICPGSFDPITFGHLDIIERAAHLADEVVVGVGQNTSKNSLFAPQTRLDLVAAATCHLSNVRAEFLDGLLVDFCRREKIDVIIKGLRFGSDFDYELQQAHINRQLAGIDTILLPAGAKWGTISSTLVREVALVGGDISSFVPSAVVQTWKHAQ